MIDVARVSTGIIWAALLVLLFPAMRRSAKLQHRSSADPVMAATWVLALNRMTFTLAALFTPNDEGVLIFCYAFAFFAGCVMLFAASYAIRRDGSRS